uniref:Uncharacterized protein n=2 Tax=Octopus bimaculoides TaxID=37653 RepID=A0A0L8HG07_OCTBM
MYPLRAPDMYFCRRMLANYKCFEKISDECSIRFKNIYMRACRCIEMSIKFKTEREIYFASSNTISQNVLLILIISFLL